MTEVNGLRLAYRGFVAGLAAGYVWIALAMLLAALLQADPLAPLRPIALALSPMAGTAELAFVLGLAGIQAGGGLVGMAFAYFFGRFFTVRATVVVAAPMATLLIWVFVAAAIAGQSDVVDFATSPIGVAATVGYGVLLGVAVPLRGEVTRYEPAGSPST